MLRVLTLIALVLLVARAAVVANRRPAPPARGETVTIELSVWGMPFESDLYTKTYIPEFERRNPNIKVKFANYSDYPNHILLAHAGGIAPDVIRENTDFSEGWIHRGLNRPLDAYMDGPDGVNREDFIPATMAGLKAGGKTYGVPQDINMAGLYYNKTLFDKAGIPYPDASWTWEDLTRVSNLLTVDKDHDGHPEVVGLDTGWNMFFFRPLVFQAGGQFWNADKTRTVVDSPEAVEALKYMKSLMKRYTLTQSNSTRGGLGPDKFFEQGRLGMLIDGSWRTPSLKTNAPDLRFGVAPLPRGKRSMTVGSSCFWAISSESRHPDEAWKLVKFLSSKEALRQYWQKLWVAPPARWSVLRSAEFRNVTGMPGSVPGLAASEWKEKCGWLPEVLEHDWVTEEAGGQYADIMGLYVGKALDQTLLENADPGRSLKVAQEETNKRIGQVEFSRGEMP
jgi:multiple sugar transport system substrate-binding protein